MKGLFSGKLAGVCLLVGLLGQGAVVVGDWEAGVAKVDITPGEPVRLAGYASRQTVSEGVLQPIHARALAIRDEAGTTILFLTVDLVGVKLSLTERVKGRIRELHGVPDRAIALVSSHTHGAPIPMDTPDRANAYGIKPEEMRANLDWTKELEEKLVAVAGAAIQGLRPASLEWGQGTATFAMNRREPTATGIKIGVNPDGPTDHRLPVLRVRDLDGAVMAIACGYACHCTTLGGEMMKVHGDYAGYAEAALEAAHPGAVAVFLTGCGGDQNPHPRGKVEQARAYGLSLAGAVGEVLAGPLTGLSGRLRYAGAEPVLRFAGPTDRESYERRLSEPNGARQAHARRMLEKLERGERIEADHPYVMQAFAVGDQLTILTMAGEVVVDYALRFAKELGTSGSLWVVAYSNDVFGYIPSLRVLKEGGYEGGESFYYSSYPTPLAEDVEEIIAGTAASLVDQVRGDEVGKAELP